MKASPRVSSLLHRLNSTTAPIRTADVVQAVTLFKVKQIIGIHLDMFIGIPSHVGRSHPICPPIGVDAVADVRYWRKSVVNNLVGTAKSLRIVLDTTQQFDIVFQRHHFLASIEQLGIDAPHHLVAEREQVYCASVLVTIASKQFRISRDITPVQRVDIYIQSRCLTGFEAFHKRVLAVILPQLNLVNIVRGQIVGNLFAVVAEEVLTIDENLFHGFTVGSHLTFFVDIHPREFRQNIL